MHFCTFPIEMTQMCQNGGVSFLIKLREDDSFTHKKDIPCDADDSFTHKKNIPCDVESELFEMMGEVSVVLAGFACRTCLSLKAEFLAAGFFFEGLWRPDLILLYPF